MAKWKYEDFLKSLRNRLDEETADYLKDDELIDYLNAGILNVSRDLKLESYETQNVTGITRVTLPSDFEQVKKIFVEGKEIPLGNLEDKGKSKDVYYIWGNEIHFTKEQTGEYELFYHKRSKTLSLPGDETDIPEPYQTLPLFYAMARCKEKDEELGLARALMEQFNALKWEMIEERAETTDTTGIYFLRDDDSY